MLIEPYERARFLVHIHRQTLLVDLLAYRGAGCCDCIHFLKNLKPIIERDHRSPGWTPNDSHRCPHIRACRAHLLDLFMNSLAQQFPDNQFEP